MNRNEKVRKICRREKEFVTGCSCLRLLFAMQQQKWLVLVYVTQLSARSFWKWFRVHFVFVCVVLCCCCFLFASSSPSTKCPVQLFITSLQCAYTRSSWWFRFFFSSVVATAVVQNILSRFSRTNESSTLKIKEESRNFFPHRRWFDMNGKSFRRHTHTNLFTMQTEPK